jgi:hypothetical protein
MSSDQSRRERRDTSPAGIWNRAQFEIAIGVLRVAGFSPDVIDYFVRRARETGRLPHELWIEIVEDALHRIGVLGDRPSK